jgi:ABC-type nitrate/sulfonate/bicarbonate transport system ATPase subunit
VSVLGRSGTGKSVLLKLIIGLAQARFRFDPRKWRET